MQAFKTPSRDFDTWASAVRQQMLDSLAKRRNTLETDDGRAIAAQQLRDSDNE
ncbi:hypothetical protein [Halomicronema sp. CCY15110]|uniref:hypothetical protein n=1 Tax=Halomicronema sp. CCY15110 TaxID=2767773 RepID=UPI0019520CC0|nr:hypothetical protein [Halomicronema sp. CCY15110]